MARLDFCFRPKEPLTFGEWGNMVKVFTLISGRLGASSCTRGSSFPLFIILAGWVNRQQQQVNEFLSSRHAFLGLPITFGKGAIVR